MTKKTKNYNAALSERSELADEDWIIRLGFLIHDAARLRRIVLDEKFKPLDITRSQAWLMAYVSRGDGQPQSALAEQMCLGKVALGGLIDRLEKTGMVERRVESEDRRVKSIYLTEKGKSVIKSMRDLTMEANKDILEGLTMTEIKQSAKVLLKLKKNIEGILDKKSIG